MEDQQMSETISTPVATEIGISTPEGLPSLRTPVLPRLGNLASAENDFPKPLDQQEQFSMTILHLLEVEPIDDGHSHPAEEAMENALKRYKVLAPAWIQAIYLKNFKRPSAAGGILRCIGRLKDDLVEPWGRSMAIRGLSHPELEVREAAVRALEMWGGQDSVEALKVYIDGEPVAWLKSYASQVINDLTKSN
jgi:hypothetical protein